MKLRALLFSCLFLFTSICIAEFRIVGYLPTWVDYPNSVNSVDLSKLTHLNIAFANPNSAGTLIPSDGTNADITTVVQKAHAGNVKVLLSIGGAGAPGNTYKTLLTSNQAAFVTSIVQYAVDYNLDGIDVDLEGDIVNGSKITNSQYQSFVTALATALHAQNKIMTAALATWFGNHITTSAASQFDFINIMSYDAAIPGSGDSPGPHAPYDMAVSDFQYWNSTKGVDGSKLNVGVPFYGYGWGSYATSDNDEISYCDIVTQYSNAENTDSVGANNNVIQYNGIPTIINKTNFALQNAGGIMIWELTEDCSDSKSLLTAIYNTAHPTATAVYKRDENSFMLKVSPNPVNEETTANINVSKIEQGKLLLYNSEGQLLQTLADGLLQPSYPISVNLKPGIYFLHLITGTQVYVTKIIR